MLKWDRFKGKIVRACASFLISLVLASWWRQTKLWHALCALFWLFVPSLEELRSYRQQWLAARGIAPRRKCIRYFVFDYPPAMVEISSHTAIYPGKVPVRRRSRRRSNLVLLLELLADIIARARIRAACPVCTAAEYNAFPRRRCRACQDRRVRGHIPHIGQKCQHK